MKLRILIIVVFVLFRIADGICSEITEVPHVLNYQSVLYDDSGNILTDGPVDINFKILNESGKILFEEHQNLDVIDGQVSALIGNGIGNNNVPTNGILSSILSPDQGKYLEVMVDGFTPDASLEIVSVPYSIYAEKALSVADGAITAEMITKNAITIDHLAEDLISEIAGEMTNKESIATTTDLTNMQTSYKSPTGASSIGVSTGFAYSASTNVQGVLQDLDLSIQKRQGEISAEINARTLADATHAAATTNIHGVGSGQIVGTLSTQTLTNKTLQAPSITNGISVTSGNIDMNGKKVVELATPTSSTDAARKQEIDSEVAARQAADNSQTGRLTALEARPAIKVWGTAYVNAGCNTPDSYTGYNIASIAKLSTYSCGPPWRVTFKTAMSNTNYAVMATPVRKNYPLGDVGVINIIEKTTSSFVLMIYCRDNNVQCQCGARSFDFTVVGN